MKDYTFDQYHQETEFTRKKTGTIHNTMGYALLGLIGELGEAAKEIDLDNIKTADELDVHHLLEDFLELAEKVEKLKKDIRKRQSVIFEDCTASEKLSEELGGVYWYLNNLTYLAGLSMSDVAKANQEMLEKRFNANPGWMTNGSVKTH